MVRRAQMQKQMDISSTKADKLLKKAETMNNRMFEKGGANMATEKKLSAEEQIEKIVRGRPWTSLTWADHKKIRKIYKEDEPNREMRKTRRLLGSLAGQRKAGEPQPKPRSYGDFAKKRKIEADRREDRAAREKAGTIKPLKADKGGSINEDPFKGDKPTGKTDKRGHPQYEREDGTKYYRLPGGDDVKLKGKKMTKGGEATYRASTPSRDAFRKRQGTPIHVIETINKKLAKASKPLKLEEEGMSYKDALSWSEMDRDKYPDDRMKHANYKAKRASSKGNKPIKRNMGGTARSNDAKKSRGAGAMIRGLIFRGVF